MKYPKGKIKILKVIARAMGLENYLIPDIQPSTISELYIKEREIKEFKWYGTFKKPSDFLYKDDPKKIAKHFQGAIVHAFADELFKAEIIQYEVTRNAGYVPEHPDEYELIARLFVVDSKSVERKVL